MKRQSILLQLDIMEYGEAWELQKSLLEARISDTIKDCLLLLQHPPTFTFGRRYKEADLLANKKQYENQGFAIYKTDRGGLATYHGPGQVVGYPIIKMCTYTKDYYHYLRMLEEVMIRTLLDFDIGAKRKEEYTGVWINEAKIGFIGVRIALGYTMHGFSLNVHNDVSPFNYITPCGIQGVTITSIQELSHTKIPVSDVYNRLANHYSDVFQTQILPVEMETMFQKIDFKEKTLHS